MSGLLRFSAVIDAITELIGRAVSWLILAAVLVSAGNALARKFAGISSNAWLELQWYLFGAVFMLAASWALARNKHVRIDILSNRLQPRTRVWIDLICHFLFLMPFALMMVWLSGPFFLRSWNSGESSMNAGGLLLWPAKLLILSGFVLFVIQGLSEIIKNVAILTGDLEDAGDEGAGHVPPELQEQLDFLKSDDGRDGPGGSPHA